MKTKWIVLISVTITLGLLIWLIFRKIKSNESSSRSIKNPLDPGQMKSGASPKFNNLPSTPGTSGLSVVEKGGIKGGNKASVVKVETDLNSKKPHAFDKEEVTRVFAEELKNDWVGPDRDEEPPLPASKAHEKVKIKRGEGPRKGIRPTPVSLKECDCKSDRRCECNSRAEPSKGKALKTKRIS